MKRILALLAVILYICLAVGLSFFPSEEMYSDVGMHVRVLNPVVHSGDFLQMDIEIEHIDKENGTAVTYKLYKEDLLYSSAIERVYQGRFTKEYFIADNFEIGKYLMAISSVGKDGIRIIIVPVRVLGAVNWWLYIMVFAVMLVVLHTSFRRFSDTTFHHDRDEFRNFYRYLEGMSTRQYGVAKAYYGYLKSSHDRLEKRASRTDSQHIGELVHRAGRRLESLKRKHLLKEINALSKQIPKLPRKDQERQFRHFENIVKHLKVFNLSKHDMMLVDRDHKKLQSIMR